MREIYFATTRKAKVDSLNQTLERHGVKDVIIVQQNIDIPELRSEDINDIALQKVKQAYDLMSVPCLAQDSGFFIDALNGWPGPFVKHTLDKLGTEGILKLMGSKHDDERSCRFIEELAYYDGEVVTYFSSISRGILAYVSRGQGWPLHRIFIHQGYEKTTAEMTSKEREQRQINDPEDYKNQFARWLLEQQEQK